MHKKIVSIIGLVLFFSLVISSCGHKGDPQPPEDAVKAPKAKAYGNQ